MECNKNIVDTSKLMDFIWIQSNEYGNIIENMKVFIMVHTLSVI